ncbi:hypothetical protein CRYUN_Cryun28dG0092600 [Craigia yunnanensis]
MFHKGNSTEEPVSGDKMPSAYFWRLRSAVQDSIEVFIGTGKLGFGNCSVEKRWCNFNPWSGSGSKAFHSSLPSGLSAGTAPDVSFDNSGREEQVDSSSVSSEEYVLYALSNFLLLNITISFAIYIYTVLDNHDRKISAGKTLKLLSGSCYLPHPDKEDTGGGDALSYGLHAINLGYSGFMVLHDFNFTYQLETGSNGDLPSSGQVHAVRAGLGPQVTTQKIAALARQRAQDRDRRTPFSIAAQDAGFRYYGGKLDDITVVIIYY